MVDLRTAGTRDPDGGAADFVNIFFCVIFVTGQWLDPFGGRPLFGGVTVTERWNPVRYPESTEVKR